MFTHCTTPSARARRGMTMMELMVSVTILAVMILGFNSVLSQSQRLVTESQRTLRANASIASVSQQMRSDVRSITKVGFLGLSSNLAAFTSAFPSSSLTSAARGPASVVVYRVANNAADANTSIFCRQAYVLADDKSAITTPYPPDVLLDGGALMDMADFQAMDATRLTGVITWVQANVSTVSVPPTDVTHWTNMWQVMVPGVLNNGTTPRFSIRYGVYDSSGNLVWTAATGNVWTRFNQNNWPAFISITFELSDRSVEYDAVRKNYVGRAYEVICAVAQ